METKLGGGGGGGVMAATFDEFKWISFMFDHDINDDVKPCKLDPFTGASGHLNDAFENLVSALLSLFLKRNTHKLTLLLSPSILFYSNLFYAPRYLFR